MSPLLAREFNLANRSLAFIRAAARINVREGTCIGWSGPDKSADALQLPTYSVGPVSAQSGSSRPWKKAEVASNAKTRTDVGPASQDVGPRSDRFLAG